MRVHVTTTLPTTPEHFWSDLSQPASLQFVAAPLVTFEPLEAGGLGDTWQVDKTYTLRLRLLGVVPLGHHHIRLIRLDRAANIIESRESGWLIPVWNHTIRFRALSTNQIHYSDEVDIQAGILTVFIWAFAQVFYRHRQRRWRERLRRLNTTV